MTSFSTFDELEASVPLSQLRPSVAFSRCAAHLPDDVDRLHGDELVQSMEKALLVHSKARVVLQCWVLLIMRRRADVRHEKDALYAHLQHTAVTPQEKIRYRRGAMLLCHLLIDREAAGVSSLLDRYLVGFYFPWSSAVNEKDDVFYLEADVAAWVRQAYDHWTQNGSKIAAAGWLALSRGTSTTAPTPPSASSASTACALSATDYPTQSPTMVPSVRSAFAPYLRSRRDGTATSLTTTALDHAPPPPFPPPPPRLRIKRKRQLISSTIKASAAAHRELATLKDAIERWAQRLRRQLLRAVEDNDKEEMQQIADRLRAPPLIPPAQHFTTTDECESEDSGAENSDSTDNTQHEDAHNEEDVPQFVEECAVCEEEPRRLAQVRNTSCSHSFCNECMFAHLSQRRRRCIYCRAKISRLVDDSGRVFQHYEWTKWWNEQRRCV